MKDKETIKTGLKSSVRIYKDSKVGETITEDQKLPPTIDRDYDEIKIVKKEYHGEVHCDECHKEVKIVYAVHRTSFISQKCSECIMKWLDRKNPEFKAELTKELL